MIIYLCYIPKSPGNNSGQSGHQDWDSWKNESNTTKKRNINSSNQNGNRMEDEAWEMLNN